MSSNDIIRSWKDEEYSNSLTEKQRFQLPKNPAGIIELSNNEMEMIAGGRPPVTISHCESIGTYGNLCY